MYVLVCSCVYIIQAAGCIYTFLLFQPDPNALPLCLLLWFDLLLHVEMQFEMRRVLLLPAKKEKNEGEKKLDEVLLGQNHLVF